VTDDEPRDWRRSYHIAMQGRVALSYEPDRQTKTIRLEDPVPYFAAGVLLAPAEALEPKWADLIVEAGAEWFIPLVRRMAAGERVSLEQVAQAYHEATGAEMTTLQAQIDSQNP
jgi:hypothetical protein